MEIIKAYKTELDPNNKQIAFFERCCDVRKFVYNVGLMEWEKQYKLYKEEKLEKQPSRYGLCKQFNAVKYDNFPWVTSVPYAVTEKAFYDLGRAFENFFRRLKSGKDPGYPVKKRYANSFGIKSMKIKDSAARITNLGWVKLKEREYIPYGDDVEYGTYVTISKRSGRWFISVPVKEDIDIPPNGKSSIIGIDVGIHCLAALSNGEIYENPKPLKKAQRKLSRLNKELDRRQKGSNNWKKTQRKIQKMHYRISNIRKHHHHEISHHITEEIRPKAVIMEDLNVKGMVRNHHLAQAIIDSGFGELRRQIEYKAVRNGIQFHLADRFYPSSKMCSLCGHVKEKLDLSERTYECGNCGLSIDRDINAARNLAALAEP